ncbi:MAG TPA: hypothetical protein VF191_04730, partial [Cyclobacteriaceae bacterium]
WVGSLPVVKIALDAYREPYRSPVFDGMPAGKKFLTAISSAVVVLYKMLPARWRHNVHKDDIYGSVQPSNQLVK